MATISGPKTCSHYIELSLQIIFHYNKFLLSSSFFFMCQFAKQKHNKSDLSLNFHKNSIVDFMFLFNMSWYVATWRIITCIYEWKNLKRRKDIQLNYCCIVEIKLSVFGNDFHLYGNFNSSQWMFHKFLGPWNSQFSKPSLWNKLFSIS